MTKLKADLKIKWAPLPPEKEAAWLEAVKLLFEIMRKDAKSQATRSGESEPEK
jgi:hypothetical protein